MYQPMIHPLFILKIPRWTSVYHGHCRFFVSFRFYAVYPARLKGEKDKGNFQSTVVMSFHRPPVSLFPTPGTPVPNVWYSCSQRLVLLFPTGRGRFGPYSPSKGRRAVRKQWKCPGRWKENTMSAKCQGLFSPDGQ